jgi:UDP-glucose 4-epimerase
VTPAAEGVTLLANLRRVRVLITGGGGFIGSHLAERLLTLGHEVRVLDSFVTGRRANLAHLADVDLVEGDVQSFERAHNAVRGCEAVLHQAALPSVPRSIQDPLTTSAVNVTGTLNVLLAARDAGVRRVVYASSSSVYGANEELPKRETQVLSPISPYAVSKLAGEGFCRSFTAIYGMECIGLRYFNVFGPRQDPLSQYSAVIPKFISATLDGRAPVVFGDGEQSRDFTYIDNVVDANVAAMLSTAGAGEMFNIACGQRVTLNEVLATLADIHGVEIQAEHQPGRPGEVRHSHADVRHARETLGYRPTVPFAEGLSKTLEYMIDERDRDRAAVG